MLKFQDNDADTNGKSIKDIEEEKKAEKEKQQKYTSYMKIIKPHCYLFIKAERPLMN